jgi:drug/metabolite transporter (DMT)-like permease
VSAADLVLLVANVVYATSYVVTRLTLDAVPPATLALLRLVGGALILVPLARRLSPGPAAVPGDRARVFWMGALGFAAAFAFAHWGIQSSTATNAALLIVVEPLAIMLLGPPLLGERLTAREGLGAGLAVTGAVLVVANGVPGLTATLAPHWRGDVLLVLAGLAYASYSLLGRRVLLRRHALAVTADSIVWGAVVMAPLAAAEWLAGARPIPGAWAVAGTAYLAVVITAGGYVAWNWALARVPAPRAAVFLNVQPIVGALLGVLFLGDRLTPFIAVGGALIVLGLALTVRDAR